MNQHHIRIEPGPPQRRLDRLRRGRDQLPKQPILEAAAALLERGASPDDVLTVACSECNVIPRPLGKIVAQRPTQLSELTFVEGRDRSLRGHARNLGVVASVGGKRNKRPTPRIWSGTMALLSKDIDTMDDLFVHQLKDIYYAEKRIVDALPKMIRKATSPKLKTAFETHLDETKNHVKRLEQVFKLHGSKPASVDCPAIDGIIKEADEVTGEAAGKEVLDAALIASAQAVEHYEMTRYGTLIAWAKTLGRNDCAQLLNETLGEEEAADKKLTKIAEGGVNRAAA